MPSYDRVTGAYLGPVPVPDSSYPFYYNNNTEIAGQQTTNTLSFSDQPYDACLYGGTGGGCGGQTVSLLASLAGLNEMNFTTDLVGILPSFVAGTNCLQLSTCIPLFSFNWTSNYTGAVTGNSGGTGPAIFGLKGPDAISGGGIGGVTILSEDYPLSDTPLPPTLPMLLSGIIGLAYVSKRKLKKRQV